MGHFKDTRATIRLQTVDPADRFPRRQRWPL